MTKLVSNKIAAAGAVTALIGGIVALTSRIESKASAADVTSLKERVADFGGKQTRDKEQMDRIENKVDAIDEKLDRMKEQNSRDAKRGR